MRPPATTPSDFISPAFLGRARAIAAEHGDLSKQLAIAYDVKVAKKAGELGTTTSALKDWEEASKVSRFIKYNGVKTNGPLSLSGSSRNSLVILPQMQSCAASQLKRLKALPRYCKGLPDD